MPATLIDPLAVARRTAVAKPYEGLNVLVIPADVHACGFYRIFNPVAYLGALGASCMVLESMTEAYFPAVDIIVAQRQYSETVLDYLKKARDYGKTIIYEIDDNLHTVMPSSPAYRTYYPGSDALKGVEKFLTFADGVTVTTPDLAEGYSKYNPNIRVIPNAIDFGLRNWSHTPADKNPDTIVVGWTGGITHQEDLQLLRDVIPAILARYENVIFGIYTAPELALSLMEKWNIERDRILFIKPQTFTDYPLSLGLIDIGLAPVVTTSFNAAKSNLKVIEYGAKAIPVVASVSAAYATTIDHGKNGFLASSTHDWIQGISALVESEELRRRMGQALQTKVRTEYDMATMVHAWPRAWADIKRMATSGEKIVPSKEIFARVQRNAPCPCGCGKKYKQCQCYGAWGK